jgi:hypothetical protein
MVNISSIPMPGALRLRALHPLIDADGSCSLIYDLERAAVLEVPAELQFHVAPALETGDWDEDLLSWLVNEDLVTAEGWAGWSQGDDGATAPDAGWWSLETVYRVEDEVHARIDQTALGEVLDVLERAFNQGFGAARVKLHLDWRTGFPGVAWLERIVVEASRLSGVACQEVAFELTLEPAEVTPIVARTLAGYPFQVRLRCGAFPAPDDGGAASAAWRNQDVDAAVRLLLAYGLADRLTLHCVLAGGASLCDLLSWVKRIGVKHLDAVRLEANGTESLAWTRRFREDLLVVADEMASDLEAQGMPVDFQPLTRIVRRLMRSEPMARFEEQPGPAPGLIAVADSYALPGVERLAPRLLLPDIWVGGVEEWESEALAVDTGVEDDDFPCRSCWARYVCSHSSLAASGLDGDDAREPSEARCAIWRDEAEAALRLYHRLAHADPVQVLRLFEEATPVPGQPPGPPGWDGVKPS